MWCFPRTEREEQKEGLEKEKNTTKKKKSSRGTFSVHEESAARTRTCSWPTDGRANPTFFPYRLFLNLFLQTCLALPRSKCPFSFLRLFPSLSGWFFFFVFCVCLTNPPFWSLTRRLCLLLRLFRFLVVFISFSLEEFLLFGLSTRFLFFTYLISYAVSPSPSTRRNLVCSVFSSSVRCFR